MSAAPAPTEQTEAVAIVEAVLELREADSLTAYHSERSLDASLRRRGDDDHRRALAAKHREAERHAQASRRALEERLTRWSQTYRPALWR